MKIATRITNQGWQIAPTQVEVVAVKGGWTTIRRIGGTDTEKVRNGELTGHAEINETTPVTAALVAKIEKAEKSAQAKAPRSVRPVLPVEERKNGVVYAGYLAQYEAYRTTTRAGLTKRSIDKGDAVALALRPLELDQVIAHVSKATGVSQVSLRERFGHLNVGMQRMNLGNMLRRALKESANG